ncbi:MAG: hypothetical protein ABJC26_00480 [Gemmatimonadaceae bacterium]
MQAYTPLKLLSAQDSTGTAAARGSMPLPSNALLCDGQKISDIIVVAQPPYTVKLPGDLEIVRKLVRKLHSDTRDIVVRRYMLLNVGDKCDEVRRAESERILRAQPFLVDARVVAFDDGHGGARLEVTTRDEFSLLVEPLVSFKSPNLRALRLGESNLLGSAMYASVNWRLGGSYRDQYGIRFEHYQFGGERNVFRMHAIQQSQGHDFNFEALRPYLTDLQHFAWRTGIGGTRAYEDLVRPGLDDNAIGVNHVFQDIGAVGRIGTVGHLKLLGLSLTRELVRIDDHTVLVTDSGYRTDITAPPTTVFHNLDVTRINALMGIRGLRFARVNGFDALNGVQDIRVGLQVGMLYGRSVQALGAKDHDSFLLGDFYAGYGNPHSFLGFQALSEARRDRSTNQWAGVLSSGRFAWYLKPAAQQLTLAEVLWSSGYNVQVPFQVSFGDWDGGLHGFRKSTVPGAHRAVFRLEQRALIPSRYNVADFGAAVFFEAGKLWAGDVPYAVTSPVRGSVGVSLLAAVPPHSRRLWRVDFAMPMGGDPNAKFEIRITNEDRTRAFFKDPSDVRRARERAVPTSLFNWP